MNLKGIIICVDSYHARHAIPVEASVIELKELAKTANIEIEIQFIQKLKQPNVSSYIGKGKVNEIKQ